MSDALFSFKMFEVDQKDIDGVLALREDHCSAFLKLSRWLALLINNAGMSLGMFENFKFLQFIEIVYRFCNTKQQISNVNFNAQALLFHFCKILLREAFISFFVDEMIGTHLLPLPN